MKKLLFILPHWFTGERRGNLPPGAELCFLVLPQIFTWIKPKSQSLRGKQKPGRVQAPDLDISIICILHIFLTAGKKRLRGFLDMNNTAG